MRGGCDDAIDPTAAMLLAGLNLWPHCAYLGTSPLGVTALVWEPMQLIEKALQPRKSFMFLNYAMPLLFPYKCIQISKLDRTIEPRRNSQMRSIGVRAQRQLSDA
jgi:hypothetical protein